jgi:uncharacterized membrane protein
MNVFDGWGFFLIALFLAVSLWWVCKGKTAHGSGGEGPAGLTNPYDLLKKRFESGDLTQEEYERRVASLECL